MNLAQVARLLSLFTLTFALAQVVPLVWALSEEPGTDSGIDAVSGFGASIAIGLLVAGLLRLSARGTEEGFFRKEGLGVVGFAWLIAGALGAIPFQWSGALADPSDALFESISGLTTTGASTLGSAGNPAIEDLPGSLLFWRSATQWFGGMGIVLIMVVLLPAMGVTGKNLLSSEQVGVSKESLRPRMREQASGLFRVYVALTGAAALLLWAFSPMSVFDALNHAMTTMATGGFSTRSTSIAAFDSHVVEAITTVFMFLAGVNFVLMLRAAQSKSLAFRTLWTSQEFRCYAWMCGTLVLIFTGWLWLSQPTIPEGAAVVRDYGSLWNCFRDASFNVVSILSSTGYGTADFQFWPGPLLVLLLLCMLSGSCSGSTTGGLKVVRMVILWRLLTYTIRVFVRPKSIERIKFDGEPVEPTGVSGIVALALLWLLSIAVGTAVVSVDPRMDVFSSLSTSTSMICCTGPALTSTYGGQLTGSVDVGSFGGYGDLWSTTKVFLAFLMMAGRLEILAPLALLIPGTWKR